MIEFLFGVGCGVGLTLLFGWIAERSYLMGRKDERLENNGEGTGK